MPKSVQDLKPRGLKAPLWLLPARSLRAISAAMQFGASKYAPWNWADQGDANDWRETYSSAAMRHWSSWADPNEPNEDDESGLSHLAHAGACVMIAIWLEGLDYQRPNDPPTKATVGGGEQPPVDGALEQYPAGLKWRERHAKGETGVFCNHSTPGSLVIGDGLRLESRTDKPDTEHLAQALQHAPAHVRRWMHEVGLGDMLLSGPGGP